MMPQGAKREVFQDLLSMQGVWGVLFFSPSGSLVFGEFTVERDRHPSAGQCFTLAEALKGERESDLVFEKARINVRRSKKGTLVVATDRNVPSAMIRLNSDILLATLNSPTPARGSGDFSKGDAPAGGVSRHHEPQGKAKRRR